MGLISGWLLRLLEPEPSSSGQIDSSSKARVASLLDLVPMEGGEFVMGNDASVESDERPAHRVRVSGLWMGRTPVAQNLWQAVMGGNPSRFKGQLRPVERVSWNDAQKFLQKLNALDEVRELVRRLDPPGTTFRLPTEAEWEHAARGGMRCGGDLPGDDLGQRDMNGNVWEWCEDWHSEACYAECLRQGVVVDPRGPAVGCARVLRGGSGVFHPLSCRMVRRYWEVPRARCEGFGFRLVLPFRRPEPCGFFS